MSKKNPEYDFKWCHGCGDFGVRRALELAEALLRPGGALLVKVFQGAEFPPLRAAFRERFDKVTVEKPKSSRSESVEVYLLGTGKRGEASGGNP